MESAAHALAFSGLGAAALATSVVTLRRRLELSKAKHRSLAGHARMSRRIAAVRAVLRIRREPLLLLRRRARRDRGAAARRLHAARRRCSNAKFPETTRQTAEIARRISDLQFTDTYRVPFQYSRFVRRHLPIGTFVQASDGVTVTDLDGNRFYDLTGSYGVNLFGYDCYKGTMERGLARVRELGPVLGPYHPVIADNVRRLTAISGLDEVSFHMSGTEAVMQAVRLARYHTRRRYLVRFCGAYHGWWGDVQPGVGNPLPARDTLTLADMSEEALRVLRTRRDIACVLVNPVQALHPNGSPPADSSLVDGGRGAHFDKAAYADWLERLRAVCSERDIVLILDEVFVGFRLAPGGAQEYFGVRADIVTYGKTVGGGFPIGVVCGRKDLMKRFRDDRPADICFARGTFNSHPVRDGRDERVPAVPRDAGGAPALRQRPRRALERAGRTAQRAPRGREAAGAGRQHVVDLDGLLHAAVALQLDAAILSPRRGPGAELDRHRPPDLQPRLPRRGFRRGGRALRRRRRRDGARRLVVVRSGAPPTSRSAAAS